MEDCSHKEIPVKNRLQQILSVRNLNSQRAFIMAVASELEVDSLECAAALLYLLEETENNNVTNKKLLPGYNKANTLPIKMVRYRLDIGSKHKLTLEMLAQVLVEESGVDKRNITNVDIRDCYTLIELPDAMPSDIFQHLKSVEINQQKLDIKRVRFRKHKKRGKNSHRTKIQEQASVEPAW
jgi:hypothetical protein